MSSPDREAVLQYFQGDYVDLNATTPVEKIKNLYDNLAETYEKVSFDGGYQAHKICADSFDQTLEKLCGDAKKTQRILDVGAGTGIIGEHLKKLGYTHIDAVDVSPKMLSKAEEKNVYEKLICAAICADPVEEIPTGFYDGSICVAAISVGHIKAQALDEMRRHIKPGGILYFTVRRDNYKDDSEFGYQHKVEKLEQEGKWKILSKELIDYYTDVDEARLKCYAFMCQILEN